jgi:hypothetical protein
MTALELILARNLIDPLELPAALLDSEMAVVYFNKAAGTLFGLDFNRTGPIPQSGWQAAYGPVDPEGTDVAVEDLPISSALRQNRAAHAQLRLRIAGRRLALLEVSGLPLVGPTGYAGALVAFWEAQSEDSAGQTG